MINGFRYITNNSHEVNYVNDYLRIPVDLCIYAFKNRLTGPLRLYIFLVSATQGNIIYKDKDLVTITLYLGKCDKTIKSYLKSFLMFV